MSISKKAAYIKGLADGLNLDENSKHDRVLLALLDVLDEMADKIDELEANQLDLTEQVDAIDLDLSEIEDELYEDFEEDFEGEFYDVTCPECGDEITVHKGVILREAVVCPCCEKKVEIDLSQVASEFEENDEID